MLLDMSDETLRPRGDAALEGTGTKTDEKAEVAKDEGTPRFGSPKPERDAKAPCIGSPKQPGDADAVGGGGLQLVVAEAVEVVAPAQPAQQALGGEPSIGLPMPAEDIQVAKCNFCTVSHPVNVMKLGGRAGEKKYKCKVCAKVDTVSPSVPMQRMFHNIL